MKIIDVHAHLYPKISSITEGQPMTSERYGQIKVGNEVRQWLPPSFTESNSTVETLRGYMDWCGIDRAVIVPNPLHGYHNEYIAAAVESDPERFRGVALVDVTKGERAAAELVRLYDQTPLMGMKMETEHTFQCASNMRMTDREVLSVLDVCEAYHQPLFLHLFTGRDLEDLPVLVRRYQNITFVLCHLGADACFVPEIDWSAYRELLDLVKNSENVYIDNSNAALFFHEEYPFPTAVEMTQTCWKTVGPEKLMWGSDYPGILNMGTFRQFIDMTRLHCGIPEAELEMILSANAERLFFTERMGRKNVC